MRFWWKQHLKRLKRLCGFHRTKLFPYLAEGDICGCCTDRGNWCCCCCCCCRCLSICCSCCMCCCSWSWWCIEKFSAKIWTSFDECDMLRGCEDGPNDDEPCGTWGGGPSWRRYGSLWNFDGDWRWCDWFECDGIVGTGETSPNDLTSGKSALISTGPETLLAWFRELWNWMKKNGLNFRSAEMILHLAFKIT